MSLQIPKTATKKSSALPKIAPLPSVGTVPTGPRVYHFRDVPKRLIQLTALFETLDDLIDARRARLRLAFLCGFSIWFIVFWFGSGDSFNTFLSPLFWFSLIFLLYGYNLRTFVMRRRSGKQIPGIGGGAGFLLFAGSLYLVPVILSGVVSLRYLKGQTTLLHSPLQTLFSLLISSVFVLSALAFFSWRRLKRVYPQKFELSFVKSILESLLPELAPNARCTLEFNPFPAFWSEWKTELAKKKRFAYFDTLLSLDLDLGAQRTLSLRFVHRRTAKGRNKNKGWKHKLKCKYVLSGLNSADNSATKDSVLRLIRERTNQQVPPKDNPFKFHDTVPAQATHVDVDSGSITVLQTFATPCASYSELTASEVPHPELVLRTIQAMFAGGAG